MQLAESLGLVAGALVTCSMIPQLIRILQLRSAREISILFTTLLLLGMVGWPIALASVGGALAGRYFDDRLGTGVQFTLILLTAGAIVGSYTACRALKGRT